MTNSSYLADDITQETYIRVYRKWHTFKANMKIKPWLYRITVNTTKNMLRKHKWLTFLKEIPETQSSNSVEIDVLKSEQGKILWSAINQLSFKYKEVIVLYYYSGFSLNEISEVLQIPIGTCKSRLHGALSTIRKAMFSNGYFNEKEEGNDFEII